MSTSRKRKRGGSRRGSRRDVRFFLRAKNGFEDLLVLDVLVCFACDWDFSFSVGCIAGDRLRSLPKCSKWAFVSGIYTVFRNSEIFEDVKAFFGSYGAEDVFFGEDEEDIEPAIEEARALYRDNKEHFVALESRWEEIRELLEKAGHVAPADAVRREVIVALFEDVHYAIECLFEEGQ